MTTSVEDHIRLLQETCPYLTVAVDGLELIDVKEENIVLSDLSVDFQHTIYLPQEVKREKKISPFNRDDDEEEEEEEERKREANSNHASQLTDA